MYIILDGLIASSCYTPFANHIIYGQFHKYNTIADLIITNSLYSSKKNHSTPIHKYLLHLMVELPLSPTYKKIACFCA